VFDEHGHIIEQFGQLARNIGKCGIDQLLEAVAADVVHFASRVPCWLSRSDCGQGGVGCRFPASCAYAVTWAPTRFDVACCERLGYWRAGPHRLEAYVSALSRRRHGLGSRWG